MDYMTKMENILDLYSHLSSPNNQAADNINIKIENNVVFVTLKNANESEDGKHYSDKM
jgi:hypothetical protein